MLIVHEVSICEGYVTVEWMNMIGCSVYTLSIVFFLFSAENGGCSEEIQA